MTIKIIQTLLIPLIVCVVLLVVMRMHSIPRSRWRSVLLMVLAGVAASFFVMVAHFEPVQHAILPFQYHRRELFMGVPFWEPRDAPEWLVRLAEHGRIIRLWPEPTEIIDGTTVTGGVMGPGRLSGVAYDDPNFVCGLPGAARDPSTIPGVHIYHGWRALSYYTLNGTTLLRGSFYLALYGVGSAVFFLCLRRMLPSARTRAALGRVDRASVLVRAAWLSVAWPAIAVLSHAFFFDLLMSGYPTNGTTLIQMYELPLVLGKVGVSGIWLGAVLGSMLTFSCVALRAAARQADSSDAEAICDACGYPVSDPHDRCPECGTPREMDSPNTSRRWRRTHTLVTAALWVAVGLLLIAPLSLPLLGALVPW